MKFQVRFINAKYENEIVSLCETFNAFFHAFWQFINTFSPGQTVKIDLNNVEIFSRFVRFISSMDLLSKGSHTTRATKRSIINIYIFIAFALDESIILDVPHFPMKNIYQSCDLGRATGRSNVNAIQ